MAKRAKVRKPYDSGHWYSWVCERCGHCCRFADQRDGLCVSCQREDAERGPAVAPTRDGRSDQPDLPF